MHLDSKAVQEQQRSTGHGNLLEKQIAAVLLVDTNKAVQEQQRSTGHGNLQEKQLLLSDAKTRAAGGGEVKTGEESCRRCRSRGDNALLAEISLLIYPGAGSW